MLFPNYDLPLFANLASLLLLFIMTMPRYISTGALEKIKAYTSQYPFEKPSRKILLIAYHMLLVYYIFCSKEKDCRRNARAFLCQKTDFKKMILKREMES